MSKGACIMKRLFSILVVLLTMITILGIYGNVDNNFIDRVSDKCLSIYLNRECVFKSDFGYINISYITNSLISFINFKQ